ncbi:hypothetical protein D3C76_604870 [compost metagenome]
MLQLLDAFQDLAFGVGGLERDIEVVQQAAEQGAIEQAKRCARVALPEVFGTGSDVRGQGFAVEVEAEGLCWKWTWGFLSEARAAADERLQPLTIVPDQDPNGADHGCPQHDFDQRGQGAEMLLVKHLEQRFQPLGCDVVIRAFVGGLVFAEAITGDGFPVLERRLIEDRLDAVPGCLAGQ